MILGTLYFVGFALLFWPWSGAGYDAVHYYGSLSSAIFDGDVDLANDFALSVNDLATIDSQLRWKNSKGFQRNLFAIGPAMLWAPFVVPVRLVDLALGATMDQPPLWVGDRFSAPYLWAVSLSTVFYGYLTLLLVYGLCRVGARRGPSLLAALCVVYASPLVWYVTRGPGMSHTHSTFAVALLLFLCFRYRRFRRPRDYVLIGAAMALAILTRWQNVIFALIPVAFWIDHVRRSRVKPVWGGEAAKLSLAVVVALAFLSIQSCYWRALYGSFVTIPQGGGFMKWASPEVARVLFSGWHGFYYCHPILFLATVSMVVWAVTRRRFYPWAFCLGFALMVYVNASVSDWWSGASFGQRRFCSSLPLLAPGLAFVFGRFRGRAFVAPVALSCVALGANLLFFSLYARGEFDIYFAQELWALRADVAERLSNWLGTFWMHSRVAFGLVAGLRWIPRITWYEAPVEAWVSTAAGAVPSAVVVLMAGALVVCVPAALARRGVPALLERRAMAILAGLIALTLALDVALLVRSPETNEHGVEFGKALNVNSRLSPKEKRQICLRLEEAGYENPALFFELSCAMGVTDDLPVWLDRVYEVSPPLFAKWVTALPANLIDDATRELAARSRRSPGVWGPPGFFSLAADAHASVNDLHGAAKWLRRQRDYQPFNVDTLRRLRDVNLMIDRERTARECDEVLLRILTKRFDFYASIHERIGAGYWSAFGSGYHELGKRLIDYHAEREDYDEAIRVCGEVIELAHWDRETPTRRQQLVLERDLGNGGIESFRLTMLDPACTEKTFVRLARQMADRDSLHLASEAFIRGLRRYPKSADLGYWFRNTLEAVDLREIPLDLLLAAEVDSSRYRAVVGDFLIRAGRPSDAATLLRRAVEDEPDNTWAVFLYAEALSKSGAAEASLRYYQTLYLNHIGEFPPYSLHYARVLRDLGRTTEALEVARAGLRNYPANAEFSALIGEIKQP